MGPAKVALIGIGNCASSLVQGIYHYRDNKNVMGNGILHPLIGNLAPGDIEPVLAIDTDARKVGKPLMEAIFAPPNCTTRFAAELPTNSVIVKMGRVLDGMSADMLQADEHHGFQRAGDPEANKDDIVRALNESQAEILVNFLPVGSSSATEFYMECALEAGVAVVNCIPVFIASDTDWARRFAQAGIPIVGDDIKAQLGATIVHRVLANLFEKRGVTLDRTYQLNTGGNTDFHNMLDRSRLSSKKTSKTQAVQSVLETPVKANDIHVGPSDFVPWLKDNKLCFMRLEGRLFGDVPMNIEVRLSVEDSPNSAGVVIDAIRCCKLAITRGQGGALIEPSAYYCKHPPQQFDDDKAFHLVEEFIA